jgi:hypothetical protein
VSSMCRDRTNRLRRSIAGSFSSGSRAPRKRGAPCALGAALLAALGRRHRARRRAAPVRRLLFERLRRGHSHSGIANGHPAHRRPRQAEQTDSGAASVRAIGSGPRLMAAPESARSQEGGSTADGMANKGLPCDERNQAGQCEQQGSQGRYRGWHCAQILQDKTGKIAASVVLLRRRCYGHCDSFGSWLGPIRLHGVTSGVRESRPGRRSLRGRNRLHRRNFRVVPLITPRMARRCKRRLARLSLPSVTKCQTLKPLRPRGTP